MMYINNNIKVDKRSPRGIPLYYIKFQKITEKIFDAMKVIIQQKLFSTFLLDIIPITNIQG